jgi:hypothetical protein
MVEDLEAEKKFIVDINISICLNRAKGTPCEIVLKVLEKMYLPKIGCDWNVGYIHYNNIPIFQPTTSGCGWYLELATSHCGFNRYGAIPSFSMTCITTISVIWLDSESPKLPGTLKTKIFDSQIIYKSLGARKSNSLNRFLLCKCI